MKSKLTHNLGLKIMAVLFSLALWMIAVDINNPVEKKVFYNVPVQMTNTGSITGQNKTYKVLDNSDMVRVTVRAPKTVLSGIGEENIMVQADFSQLSDTSNTVPIKVVVTDKYLDKNIESVQLDKENVYLEIENRETKQLSIEVVKSGTLPDGYITGRIVTETNMMSLSGPESAIEPAVRAIAEVPLDNATSNVEYLASIKLLDNEGVEINNSDIKKSIDSVKVTVPILKTKEVPLSFHSTGTPAEGYLLTGSVTATPDKITIAGKESAISDVNSIEIPESEFNVADADESVSAMVDIRKYLPSDVTLGDPSFSGYVTLTAEIEPVRKKTVSITESTIQRLNVPEGWQAEIVPDQGLKLNISGLQRNLNNVDETVLVPHVDVSTLLGTDGSVPAGEQEITVNFLIPDNVKQEGAVKAIIRLTKKEE